MYLHRASSELKTHRESGVQLSRAEQVSQEEESGPWGRPLLKGAHLPGGWEAPPGSWRGAGRETKAGTSRQPWTRLVAGFPSPQAASTSDPLMSLSASILTFPGRSKAFLHLELSSTWLTLLPAGTPVPQVPQEADRE